MEKIRVVVAEDHAFVREATHQLLEQEPDIDFPSLAAAAFDPAGSPASYE